MMRHFAHQCVIAVLKTCNLSLASPGFLCEVYVVANWLGCVPDLGSGMFDTQRLKRVDDRIAPCGIPALSVRG